MHHRVDAVLTQGLEHGLAIADLADDERGVEDRLAEAPREIVEDDDPLAARAQLQDDVAADIAGAAGHEDAGLFHAKWRYALVGWMEIRARRR